MATAVKVDIRMRDGRIFRHHERVNRGAGEHALTAADIERKYYENALMALSKARTDEICEAALTVDKRSATRSAQLLAGGRAVAGLGCQTSHQR